VDIYGTLSSKDNAGAVIIELDKWRADQVAKKFVLRFALTLELPLICIALCYGGTQYMNKSECENTSAIARVFAILSPNIIYVLQNGFTAIYSDKDAAPSPGRGAETTHEGGPAISRSRRSIAWCGAAATRRMGDEPDSGFGER